MELFLPTLGKSWVGSLWPMANPSRNRLVGIPGTQGTAHWPPVAPWSQTSERRYLAPNAQDLDQIPQGADPISGLLAAGLVVLR